MAWTVIGRRHLLVAAACGVLGACSGGGGGGDVAAPPAPPPAATQAPSISQQPTAAPVTAGQTVTLTVLAAGTAPLSYQWRRDGVAIAGATAAIHTTAALGTADNGARYSVQVSNAAGSVLSAEAVLSVQAVAAAPTGPSISAGVMNSMAVAADGSVLVWGNEQLGQYGTGTAVAGSTAVRMPLGVSTVTVGYPGMLALRRDGQVLGWGRNPDGAIGDIDAVEVRTPRVLPGLAGSVGVATTGDMTFAVKADGTVWHLPGDVSGTRVSARQVPGLDGVSRVVASYGTGVPVLAIRADGSVWSLAVTATRTAQGVAYAVAATAWTVPGPVSAAACSAAGCLLLLRDGTLHTRPTGSATSTPVPLLTGVRAVAARVGAHLALDATGQVWEIGTTAGDVPVAKAGATDASELSAGLSHVLFRRTDGSVWGWGSNLQGELGDGTRQARDQPVQALGIQLN